MSDEYRRKWYHELYGQHGVVDIVSWLGQATGNRNVTEDLLIHN